MLARAIAPFLALIGIHVSVVVAAEPYDYSNVSLSPGGEMLLFDRCGGERPRCRIHALDLKTESLGAFDSPEDEVWWMASFDREGRRIVFVRTRVQSGKRSLGDSQLATMDITGANVRVLTHGPGLRVLPSFSLSGKKIIYARGRVRNGGRTAATDFDVFELEDGIEKRLTDFSFFQISPPFYLEGDVRFVFSGEYPLRKPNESFEEVRARRAAYKEKYKENTILAMTPGERALIPWVQLNGYSYAPLTANGGKTVYFRAQAYTDDGKPDGIQFFRYSADGMHKRLTRLRSSAIWAASVSDDGAWLSVLYTAAGAIAPRSEPRLIELINLNDGTARRLQVSGDAATINR